MPDATTSLLPAAALLALWTLGDPSLPAVEFTGCFALNPDRILLHAHGLQGVPGDGYFILDTGSSIVAVDTQCRSLLSGAGQMLGAGLSSGSGAMLIQQTVPFDVGGLRIRAGLMGAIFNLAYVHAVEGYNALGLIGYPVLAGKVIDIDPEAGACRILDALPRSLDLGEFDRLPCGIAHAGQIRLTLAVAGHRLPLLLDTGKPGFLDLTPAAFATLEQEGQLIIDPNPQGVAGSQRSFGLCKDLTIGSWRFAACKASTASEPTLGMEFLRNFHCIIDYRGACVYLKPNREYPTYQPPSEPPLRLRLIDERVQIMVKAGIAGAALRATVRPHAARDRWPACEGHGFRARVPAPRRLRERPGQAPCRGRGRLGRDHHPPELRRQAAEVATPPNLRRRGL